MAVDLGNRVCVFGPPGSGKSTLARMLGEALALPVVHMDALFWKPGWVESLPEEIGEKVRQAALGEHWIIEGNYSKHHRELRLSRATAVIVLAIPRPVRMWAVVWRCLRNYGKTRPDIGEDCPERLDWDFLKFVWRWPAAQAAETNIAAAAELGLPCHVLRSRRQINRLVSQVTQEKDA